MRLATYESPFDRAALFGVIIADEVFSIAALQREAGTDHACLAGMSSFVAAPAVAQSALQELVDFSHERIIGGDLELQSHERVDVHEARWLVPLPTPAGLLDLALTPLHVQNAAMTILRHEFKGLKRIIAKAVIQRKLRRAKAERLLPYYIGNHNAVVGDGDTVGWPEYTSYLDIEPELAVITGPPERPIAGYTIFNDVSARDVQMPELDTLSLTRSKHFDGGNGLGPFLVTPDDVGDPRKLQVTARVGDRFTWRGSTTEYSVAPEEALEYLHSVFTPAPGVIVGLGTVPGCCGLDNDLWLLPGEDIEITFEKLGTLRQKIPKPIPRVPPSRWGERHELRRYFKEP